MKFIKDRAVKLRLRNPNRVTTLIPKSKRLSKHEVLVHWGLEESRVLNNLGIKVPSPISKQYKWPGLHKPYSHQKESAAFLTLNPRAFNFSEQGTGKTFAAIWAADYLMKSGIIDRVLILCPLSIMDTAWKADLFKAAMHRTVQIVHGSRKKRQEILAKKTDFDIINYDGVKIVQEELKANNYDLIIMDEATYLKNVSTDRWSAIDDLIDPTTWVWMMTGTPAAQSPVDAFGLAKMMNRESVPRSMVRFRDEVMYKVTNFKWVAKPTATQRVHEVLQPAIRFTKDECLDLPPMVYSRREIPLTPQQKKYYRQLRQEAIIAAAGEQVTAANAAILINKLLQLSSGAMYSDNKETLEFDIKARFNALLDVINETDQKVLVFAPFRHCIDMIVERLRKKKITCDVIRGDVSAGRRADIFKRFQSQDEPRVLVIQPQAAAHGVTLTAADTVVWWGPTSSLEIYAQANVRVHRSGQHHPCSVIQLIGSDVERHMYDLLDQRIDAHSKIIDLYKNVLDNNSF